jgi:uncharacterized BrkB/YihY/UPF0761 family membrane protein
LSNILFFGIRVLHTWSDSIGGPPPRSWDIFGEVARWVLTVLMFWIIYRLLPNATPGRRGRVALIAALVATVGWQAAQWGYARFMSGSPHYGLVYGSVAGVVLTLMWLYLSSTIILLGAETAAAWEETRAAAQGEAKPTQDKPDDEGAALPESGPAAADEVREVVVNDKAKTEEHSS